MFFRTGGCNYVMGMRCKIKVVKVLSVSKSVSVYLLLNETEKQDLNVGALSIQYLPLDNASGQWLEPNY